MYINSLHDDFIVRSADLFQNQLFLDKSIGSIRTTSDFIWPFLRLYMGVIPYPKMAFIFPISCILALIFPILIKYFPKCVGKGSFPKSQIKSLTTILGCQTVWIQIRTDNLSVLIWVQTVCQNAEKVTHIKGRLLYQAVILYSYVPFQNWNFS